MKEEKEKIPFGVAEWGVSKNLIRGCKNNCCYCYSKSLSIRYKRNTPEDWENEQVNFKQLKKKFKKENNVIMFPSTHDLSPENLEYNLQFLGNLLESGNNVLIVSKAHLSVIESICEQFKDFKSQILFRITIGSMDNNTLKLWEPGAPDYNERKAALQHAYNLGFETSVSAEPYLDENVFDLVNDLSEFVSETLWIGKINYPLNRLKLNGVTDPIVLQKANDLIQIQSDENVLKLYYQLKDNPKIRWKESIKKVLIKNQIAY